MKKLFALLLAVCIVVSMFAGCGNQTTKETEANATKAPSNEEQNTATEAQVSRSDLTNMDVYPLDVDDDVVFNVVAYAMDMDTNETYIAKLWEEVTGVKINYLDWTQEQYTIALRDNDLPDACYRNYGLDKAGAYEMGQAGKLVNFMDYLDIMPNLAKYLEAYPAAKLAATNEDGSMYCLPTVISTAGSQPNLVYVRTDMAEAAGWTTMPTTVDELLQMALDIQETYSDVEGFHAMNFKCGIEFDYDKSIAETFLPCFGELVDGGLTADRSGNVVYAPATEQYKHYLEWFNKVWESGAFATEFYADDGTMATAARSNDLIAIDIISSGWSVDNFDSGNMELVILEPLTSEYWSEQHWKQRQQGAFHSSWISTSCQDIETMCKWFDSFFATEDDPIAEGVWSISTWLGVYGTDWVCETEGSTGYTAINSLGGGDTIYYPFLGDTEYYLDAENNAFSIKCAGTMNNLRPYAELAPIVKQLPLSVDDQDTADSKMADIYKYTNEMIAKFVTGETDIEEGWDSYVSTLEKMGINDVTSIYQTYYNEYNAG